MASSSGVAAPVAPATRRPTAALVGNPNTGKTTLFNALSGLRQRVGNYPGVTVETKKGQMTIAGQVFDLIDLPGTYSLAPRSPDEMVAVDVILGQQTGEARPDVVVAIVDASNLERNLYLTTQLLELGVPVVIALNMLDVAEGQGLKVDAERLARQIGLPVIPIQANKGKNLDALKQAIARAAAHPPGQSFLPEKKPTFPDAFECETQSLQTVLGPEIPAFLVRRLLLDVGGYIGERLAGKNGQALSDKVEAARQRLQEAGCPVPAVEARCRYAWIREVTAGVVERPAVRPVTATDRLDRVLTHRLWGTLIFLLVMFLVFQSIFTLAKPIMDWINAGRDFLADLVEANLAAGPLESLLREGVIFGVGAVVVFLPQILILFAVIALLEDCGYMARAAFLMDRLMSRAGLSGKSFIPLLSSMACAVPGIMATRVIENRRDRLATILVAPLMSCSARLPVYVLMIALITTLLTPGYPWWVPGLIMFSMYLLGLILAPVVAYLLKRTLLRGETPVFVMEMPTYKLPSPRLVVRRMLESGWAFLHRAGTIILASMILIWALLYFPSTNAEDAQKRSYAVTIAELKDPIREELQTLSEKEKSIAREMEQIELLAEREEKARESEKPGLQARREELEKQVAPTLAEIKALKEKTEPVMEQINRQTQKWKQQSILGRLGQWIEPAVAPLGWDWRLGVAALASFPAREVVVGTLGILFELGKVDPGEIKEARKPGETELGKALRQAQNNGRPLFTIATALSLMVFFALCCQCASTLAVIRRETGTWRWPAFTFTYMTVLAYLAALLVYQTGTALGL